MPALGSAPVSRLVFVPLLTAVFLGGIDLTVLNTALPAIDADLAPSASARLWIIDGYTLAIAALLVTAARLGDRYGRRRMLALGLLGFGAASLVAGLAPNAGVLIAARVVQGAADSLIIASVVGSIGAVFRGDSERAVAYGLWTAAVSLGQALGPVLGGMLVQWASWRWVFIINVPITVLAAVATRCWLPDTRVKGRTRWDAASVLLSVVGLGGAIYALQHLVKPDVTVPVIGAAGLAMVVLFLRRQRRLTAPLLDLTLFAGQRFRLAFVAIVVNYGVNAALLLLLSVQLQRQEGRGALAAGITLVPIALAVTCGGLVTPWLLRMLDRVTAVGAAMVLQALALVGLTVLAGNWRVTGLIVAGLTFGAISTAAADLLMSVAPLDKVGQAGAVQETGFALGAGLGVAVFGTIAATIGASQGFRVALAVAAALALAVALWCWTSARTGRRRDAAGTAGPAAHSLPQGCG